MTANHAPDVALLLTHSGDYYTVERVAAALARRGARPLRLDTDLFPLTVRLTTRLGGDAAAQAFIDADGQRMATEQVRAVWARRIWPARLDDKLDARFHETCRREARAGLAGFLDSLHAARWVNERQRERAAENKLYQLRAAEAAGLAIPCTLLTNDPAEARAFYTEVAGALVAKLLRPVSSGMDAAPEFVYTSDVSAADLDEAEQLRHSPMLFQERVPKACELRVAYVAGRCFTGALDASLSARGQTDWRLAEASECAWRRDELPAEVARGLHALMTQLGLVYGAIDLIRTPAGEHVFLEVNPGGEWGMLERDLALPVADALAAALLEQQD
jgi:MvdC family ATP-grasp ribosomal peptide maturase